jgi:putative phosphoribosyl transferase
VAGYEDRTEAGRRLATELAHLRGRDAVVLAVPRGGIPVGAEVATALGATLDLVITRKIGAPGNPELAIGAVAAVGEPYVDRGLVDRLGVPEPWLAAEVERQAAEVARRERAYRGGRPAPPVEGRVVIVTDDGVATGATLRATLGYLRSLSPAWLCCAVPVGPPETITSLGELADEVVCPLQPPWFMAVGEWYRDFHQVDDIEVATLLAAAWGAGPPV